MKAYMYFRVSTDDKGQQAENQEADVMQLYAELCPEAEIIKVFEEASAYQDNNRPKFQETIKKFIQDKEAKYLLAWDYDRIYRDRRRFISLMRELSHAGKTVVTSRQKYMLRIMQMPEPWNEVVYDLLLQVYGEMAEDESKKKSERVKAAYNRKKNAGKANNWGKHGVDPRIIRRIKEIKTEKPDISIRRIKWVLEGEGKRISIGKIQETIKQNEKVPILPLQKG